MGFGIASLVRGPALLVPGVLAVLIVLEHRLRRVAFVRIGLLGAGLILAITPWTVRNQVSLGAPILISSDGAYAFFNSHNPYANGSQDFHMSKLRRRLFRGVYFLRNPEREVAMERAEIA